MLRRLLASLAALPLGLAALPAQAIETVQLQLPLLNLSFSVHLSELENPEIDDQSWPDTGWTADPGPCDCFVTPQTVTECDPVECPAVTDLAATSVKEVCE